MRTRISYPPPPATDDSPALQLLAAIAEQARADASAGSRAARAWLVWIAGPPDAPVPAELVAESEALATPTAAQAVEGQEKAGKGRIATPPVELFAGESLAARALPLALAAGWPGRLAHGAAAAIAEQLGCNPGSLRNALHHARRAVAAD